MGLKQSKKKFMCWVGVIYEQAKYTPVSCSLSLATTQAFISKPMALDSGGGTALPT